MTTTVESKTIREGQLFRGQWNTKYPQQGNEWG